MTQNLHAHAVGAALAPFSKRHERMNIRAVCLLIAIDRKPGFSTREYAKHLDIPVPAVKRNLDSLGSYVTQVKDEHDGRKVVINLTREGIGVVESLNEIMKLTIQSRGKTLAPIAAG